MLRFTILCLSLFLLFLLHLPSTVLSSGNNCVEEFGQCVTNRDCCGREERGDKTVECLTGDWEVTTDSTCLSKRSQELEALSKEYGLHRHQTLSVFLKYHVYELPEIREKRDKRYDQKNNKTIDPLFYEKVADKYRHEFPKLIVNLERKYEISDTTVMPSLIREFSIWKETMDIAEVFARGLLETEETRKTEL